MGVNLANRSKKRKPMRKKKRKGTKYGCRTCRITFNQPESVWVGHRSGGSRCPSLHMKFGDSEFGHSCDESNHDIGAEKDGDMSCSDEVRNDISENGTTEVPHLELDGNNYNDMEEDGDNDNSDDDFPISDMSKMPSYEE